MSKLRRVVLPGIMSVFLAAQFSGPNPAGAAQPVTSEPYASGTLGDERPPLVAVYLSIKQRHGSFVLASTRHVGAGYRKRLVELAEERHLEVVLPVVTDILAEAMTAVRIAVHDSSGLRAVARMQGAKTVLAGRLEQVSDKNWSVTWSISNKVGKRRWRIEHVSFDAALTDGLTAVTQVMAGELAVDPYPLPKLLPMRSEDVEASRQREENERLPDALPE